MMPMQNPKGTSERSCKTKQVNQNPYLQVCGESARPPAQSLAALQGLEVRILLRMTARKVSAMIAASRVKSRPVSPSIPVLPVRLIDDGTIPCVGTVRPDGSIAFDRWTITDAEPPASNVATSPARGKAVA